MGNGNGHNQTMGKRGGKRVRRGEAAVAARHTRERASAKEIIAVLDRACPVGTTGQDSAILPEPLAKWAGDALRGLASRDIGRAITYALPERRKQGVVRRASAAEKAEAECAGKRPSAWITHKDNEARGNDALRVAGSVFRAELLARAVGSDGSLEDSLALEMIYPANTSASGRRKRAEVELAMHNARLIRAGAAKPEKKG